MMNRAQIVDAFTPNLKLGAVEKAGIQKNQSSFIDLATDIEQNIPLCPARTKALNHLLEAKFWCSQALTHEKNHEIGMEKANAKG